MHLKLLSLTSLAGFALAQLQGPFQIASADEPTYFFKVEEPIQSGSQVTLLEGGPGDLWTYDDTTNIIALPDTTLVLTLNGVGLEVQDNAAQRNQRWTWDLSSQLIHSNADIAQCITRIGTEFAVLQCQGAAEDKWVQVFD